MITTSDERIAERARMLRFHGSRDKVTYEQIGYNSRLDELQAAILRVQLPHLDGWADGRRAAGRHYEQAGLGELVDAARARSPARAGLAPLRRRAPASRAAGSGARRRGHRPQGLLPHARPPPGADARVGRRASSCPATEEAARTHLAIPISPVLTRAQADEVVPPRAPIFLPPAARRS